MVPDRRDAAPHALEERGAIDHDRIGGEDEKEPQREGAGRAVAEEGTALARKEERPEEGDREDRAIREHGKERPLRGGKEGRPDGARVLRVVRVRKDAHEARLGEGHDGQEHEHDGKQEDESGWDPRAGHRRDVERVRETRERRRDPETKIRATIRGASHRRHADKGEDDDSRKERARVDEEREDGGERPANHGVDGLPKELADPGKALGPLPQRHGWASICRRMKRALSDARTLSAASGQGLRRRPGLRAAVALFCPTCGGLLARRTVGGRVVATCGKCGPRASAAPKAAAPPGLPVDGPSGLPKELARLFPHSAVRDGQRDFLLDAHEAVRTGQHLLANAPTGIGKTVSSLVAALAVARPLKKRVFFLTSKQSQHRIVVETLTGIRKVSGEPIAVADLIAKHDMCPRPEAQGMNGKQFSEFCRREQATKACELFRNALSDDRGVVLLKKKVLHVEEAVRQLDRLGVCPHQATVDAAQTADVVVCDYNMLFSDMRAGMQERLKVDLADVILVVDEAHNLPDRIRDHLAIEIHERLLLEAEDEAERANDGSVVRLITPVRRALDTLVAEVASSGTGRRVEGEMLVTREKWHETLSAELKRARGVLEAVDYDGLVKALTAAAVAYEKNEKAEPRGLLRLQQFLEIWKIERRGLARILSRDRFGDWSLAYKLLDPSILAKPVFDAVHSAILMSGTLHPCEASRDVLGLDPGRSLVALYESPFARSNRLVLADTSVTTKYEKRTDETFERIASHIAQAADATPGHAAAFFPSYALLEQVRSRLDTAREVVVEERGLDKEGKERLVGQLRSSRRGLLLLGVQGGSLSEGYDYEGNLLKLVAIVGLPLAPPNLEVEKLIEYYSGKFGAKGRDYAYTYPAMNRVMQAAGRLIRSETDRGVVLLMDERFTWSNYRACFPPDLAPRATQDPAPEVRAFFTR